tara:strand:+ start:370 stop:582 length:213 start_codon:yes stop_codon:yes gene_type:complete
VSELDLHGANYEEVVIRCHRFINENWGKRMSIITGKSDEMKRLVAKIIDTYRLEYHVGGASGTDGCITIR